MVTQEILGLEHHLRRHLLRFPWTASAKEGSGTAAHAESEKAKKYAHLDWAYQFQLIAAETCGTVRTEPMCFLRELCKRLKSLTGESSSFACLLERFSVAIQVGSMSSVLGSLPDTDIDLAACI